MEAPRFPHALPVSLSYLLPVLHLQSETGDSLRSLSCWSQLTQLKEGVIGALESSHSG